MKTGAGARAHGATGLAATGLAWLSRASVPLCLCALSLSCTDPRARPAPPAVKIYVGEGGVIHSPGTIAVTAIVYDAQGVDSLHLTLKSPFLQGDSLYLIADTTDVIQSVLWSVPSGIPVGTNFTLSAKAWDLLGFVGEDTTVVASQ